MMYLIDYAKNNDTFYNKAYFCIYCIYAVIDK